MGGMIMSLKYFKTLMKHVEIPVSHFSGLPEIFGETNTKLEEQIKIVVNQALKNYENR